MEEKSEQVRELQEQLQDGKINRRTFLRYVGVLGVSAGTASALAACGAHPVVVEKEVEVTRQVEVPKEIKVTREVPATVEAPATVQEAMGRIVVDRDLCAGCMTCNAVCSLSHHGAVSTQLSAIQIVIFPFDGALIDANTCRQCTAPECVYICPTKACHVDPETGARVIDSTKCIGCGLCQRACPNSTQNPYYDGDGLSPIRYDAENQVYFKCDLCGGDPQCVKFCPQQALTFSTKEI